METILNLAWVACSLGLIAVWVRGRAANPSPVKFQIFALAMIVLLLLPVISLSDDLIAMQGPSETDSCVRRVLHADEGHPSVVPACMALPEQTMTVFQSTGFWQIALQTYSLVTSPATLNRSHDRRPPPQA